MQDLGNLTPAELAAEVRKPGDVYATVPHADDVVRVKVVKSDLLDALAHANADSKQWTAWRRNGRLYVDRAT